MAPRLGNGYLQAIKLMAGFVEAKDRYTGAHVERVMEISIRIAQCMGLTPKELELIRLGSILHDIGKIGISDDILNKEDSLTQDELERMKQHVEIGVELVKNIPFLRPVIPIIRHHHERYDGSGYPDGLSGEAIPLSARIVAVADCFDALTSQRPYRKRLSQEQGLTFILQASGRQFDPEIAIVFKTVWAEMISEKPADEMVSNSLLSTVDRENKLSQVKNRSLRKGRLPPT